MGDKNGSSVNNTAKDCCACSEKHKERSPEEYRDLINRLSRIEGQVRGIKAMVERGDYCPDILIQTSAVNSALNSFSKVLLSNHIRTCVRNDIRDGNDEVVEELVATLQKMMKKPEGSGKQDGTIHSYGNELCRMPGASRKGRVQSRRC